MSNVENGINVVRRLTVDEAHLTRMMNGRRQAALANIDGATFSWFHVRICMVAGIGFFTESYDTFAINIASTMLAYVYGKDQKLSFGQDLGVKVSSPVGTLFGQLLFGFLADKFGRKRIYGVELLIIIIATFGQAISGGAHAVNIIGILVVWRFIMGIGIGGDYPASAVISSEFSPSRTRGRMMIGVFSSQGWGNFAAALVGLVVVAAYKDAILSDSFATLEHVDVVWRLLIGLGCVPGTIALYFRLTIPESPRFTMDIQRDVIQASTDIDNALSKRHSSVSSAAFIQRVDVPKATWADFRHHFSQWKNLKILIGTSVAWFSVDISFYALGLNSSVILQAIGFGGQLPPGTQGVYSNLKNICVGNLILSAAGLIPGYYFSFYFVDSWGRKPIQLMGFTILTVLFLVLGFGYGELTRTPATTKGFIVLFCLASFFQNFGPNVTTFIIPGEAFPTRYRSTVHGISAASGKLGAIVAQVGFAKLKDIGGTDKFLGHIFEIIAFFMLVGIGSTLLLPETMGKGLEELSNESQAGFVTGVTRMTEVDKSVIVGHSNEPTATGNNPYNSWT